MQEGNEIPACAGTIPDQVRSRLGSEEMIVPGNRRPLQKRLRSRRRLFGKRLKERFLEHLAARKPQRVPVEQVVAR